MKPARRTSDDYPSPICPACYMRHVVHTTFGDSRCGPCTVAEQVERIGTNEGRTYERQPHMVHGIVTYWEVYERSRDGRRFHCTWQEWERSAAARRMGAVRLQDGLCGVEGGEGE